MFDKRWQWIEQDMYPRWLDLADSGASGDLVATPLGELAAGQRLIPDWLLHYEPGP